MQKILIAQFRYHIGHINASSISTNELATFLHKKGWQVAVLSPKSSTKTPYKLLSYNHNSWQERELILNLIKFVRKINELANKYSLIYLIIPNPAFLFIADLIKNQTNKVIVRSECSFHNFEGFKPSFSKIGIYTFFTHLASLPGWARLSKFPHTCLLSTNFQKNELVQAGYPAKKIYILPNTTQKIASIKNRKTGSLFSYIGHYNIVKGVHILVDAIAHLVNEKKITNIKFQFASANNFYQKGELLKLINKHKIKKYIKFYKHVNMNNFLQKSKALILPYAHAYGTQLYPNLVLEAIQMYKPLITSNIKPLTELLSNNKTALIVKKNDPIDLAKTILKLNNSQKLEKQLVQNIRLLSRKINPDLLNQKHLELFKKIIKNDK